MNISSKLLQLYLDLDNDRETTLPMLKTLDEEERLRVVDGDKAEKKVTPSA